MKKVIEAQDRAWPVVIASLIIKLDEKALRKVGGILIKYH